MYQSGIIVSIITLLLARRQSPGLKELMPGSHLWDNQVLCPQLPSHPPLLHLTAKFISLNLCLHYITPVIKNYNGVCLPVYWFMPKYFNVAFLVLHKLYASHKFYFLAGWLPISPGEQSYLRHQPFTNCFFPCLSRTSLSKYFRSYPSFEAPSLVLLAAVLHNSAPHYGSSGRRQLSLPWFHDVFTYCVIFVTLVFPSST